MKRDGSNGGGRSEKVKKTLRGRTEKACVRCRAKKRTCDGGNPCMRCQESHNACYFSDWHYTVLYPREYVEYLEEQQEQLSAGIMAMYRLLKDANLHTFSTLSDKPEAQAILAALKESNVDSMALHWSRPSLSNPPGTLFDDGLRIQISEETTSPREEHCQSMALSPSTHSAVSPIQPASTYMQHFGPAYALVTAPVHHSYSPASYQTFESTPPMQTYMHPQMLAVQTQPLPQALPTRPDILFPCSACTGIVQIPEPWRPSLSSFTPSTSASLERTSDQPPTFVGPTGTHSTETAHENMCIYYQTDHDLRPWH